eukprot:15366018-Ditylum_brightwellii.AAC.1
MRDFNSMKSFAIMEGDSDTMKITNQLASKAASTKRINLGIATIKCLQAFVFWIKDRIKMGLSIMLNEFIAAAMKETGQIKVMRKELKDKAEADIKNL